jgi:HPr kinase/phosphorylase
LEIQVHGALVEILGVGVLLRGASGIGKSECALELVQRGYRLVADDVVRIDVTRSESHEPPTLVGRAPELIRHYMEIRGIGLVCVPDLYGPASVLLEARIDLVCRLERWQEDVAYERIGLERPTESIAGVDVSSLVLPVRPASNMATLVELAARDHVQRMAGVNAAKRLDERLRGETRAAAEGRKTEEGGPPAENSE